jgi:SPP1 family predicted phage head-tail adaptor
MRAGRLRHKVTLQRRVETTNAIGETVWYYADVAEIFAHIEPLSGKEYFGAQQVQSDVTTRVRVRYRTGLQPTMRLVHVREAGSPTLFDYYDIQSIIQPHTDRRELQLMCIRRDAEGFRTDGNA